MGHPPCSHKGFAKNAVEVIFIEFVIVKFVTSSESNQEFFALIKFGYDTYCYHINEQ